MKTQGGSPQKAAGGSTVFNKSKEQKVQFTEKLASEEAVHCSGSVLAVVQVELRRTSLREGERRREQTEQESRAAPHQHVVPVSTRVLFRSIFLLQSKSLHVR